MSNELMDGILAVHPKKIKICNLLHIHAVKKYFQYNTIYFC